MNARVNPLVVMRDAMRVANLCDPLVRARQHPANNSLEAQAFNLRGVLPDATAQVAELVAKATMAVGAMEACGCWNAITDDLIDALAPFTEPTE